MSVQKIIQENLDLVLALNTDPIVKAAKKIAFYTAMLNAAPDPVEYSTEAEAIEILQKELHEQTKIFQDLVDDQLK